jgi:uncharacterized protein
MTDETNGWESKLVDERAEIQRILGTARRIAVLGIKPASHAGQPAHWVPEYLQSAGYEIVPIPVYFPDATEILGEPVVRSVDEAPGPIDLVLVFRRPGDLPGHLDDLLAARPPAVWLQSGIRNDEFARRLAEAGIQVVQDRCAMIEHRMLTR